MKKEQNPHWKKWPTSSFFSSVKGSMFDEDRNTYVGDRDTERLPYQLFEFERSLGSQPSSLFKHISNADTFLISQPFSSSPEWNPTAFQPPFPRGMGKACGTGKKKGQLSLALTCTSFSSSPNGLGLSAGTCTSS